MNWERLISSKRLGLERIDNNEETSRTSFRRDYDRIIFSSPFRRMQNKTQVFPLPGSIFVHNRLTHSLEVASVGNSLARESIRLLEEKYPAKEFKEIMQPVPDIVSTACLCHDLGNPPFGHSGEKTISTWFTEGNGKKLQSLLSEREWEDFANFEGNANSFRLLTHKFEGRREGGFAMTYSSIASIVKYPWSSLNAGEKGKFGFFISEENIYRKIAEELGIPEQGNGKFSRYPLVYLMEAADDICYQVMDIEDAHRLGILSFNEVKNLLLPFFDDETASKIERGMNYLQDPNEKVGFIRSKAIGEMVYSCANAFVNYETEIMDGKEVPSLIEIMDSRLADAYRACAQLAMQKIYNAPYVVDVDLAGNTILNYLLDVLTEAVLNPEKNFSKLLLGKIPVQYNYKASSIYGKIQSVLDHISGMTDIYALDLFRKLNGHSLPEV